MPAEHPMPAERPMPAEHPMPARHDGASNSEDDVAAADRRRPLTTHLTNEADTRFLFVCCQVGAEQVCKQRMNDRWPDYRFSFSRPGFLTYKVPAELGSEDAFAGLDLQNTFVRTFGESLGRVQGGSDDERVAAFWRVVRTSPTPHLHVWQRDRKPVGERFEPFPTERAEEVARLLGAAQHAPTIAINQEAAPGEQITDCILIDDDTWWIGRHTSNTSFQAWPGGVPLLHRNPSAVSRAYYKMYEALLWSRLPVRKGDLAVEIGCAPGGSVQALLELGLSVIGVDPAVMHESLAEHPRLKHIRKRGRDVRKRELAGAKWLFADSNVTPQQTLDTIEDIVLNDNVHVRGMLLTLKMPDWKLAGEIPAYLNRVRSWGYKYVKPRQLAFNRQEVCVFALKHRSLLRTG